jgi:hypothetical protein
MKELNVFSYYFPPNDAVGTRRVNYWIKYFTKRDYNVNVFTCNHGILPDYLTVIPNLNIYYITFSGIKDAKQYKRIQANNGKVEVTESKLTKVLKTVKRKFINPFLGQLFDYRILLAIPFYFSIKNKRFDHIRKTKSVTIATTPPWFVLYWAILFKRRSNTKLIIDYRDQFSNNPMFAGVFVSLEKRLDKFLSTSADHITVVSEGIKNYYGKWNQKVNVIYNGFDEEKFTNIEERIENPKATSLEFSYYGSILHESRIPGNFIHFLSKNVERYNFVVNTYGDCDYLERHIKDKHPNLLPHFIFNRSIPFDQVAKNLEKSNINLVFEEKNPTSQSQFGTIPTKIFEYIAAGRPIIAEMSQEVEAYKFLKKSGLLLNNFDERNDDLRLDTELEYDLLFAKTLSREFSTSELEKIMEQGYNSLNN